VAAQTDDGGGAAAAPLGTTVEVTATRIDGEPIPRDGYEFSSAYISLRREDPSNRKSRIVLRLEVEITIECEDDQGRPARCPKTSIYSLPDEDFRIRRPKRVSRFDRGFVDYVGGGRNVRLGRITGIGQTEWIRLDREHRIEANHRAVKLIIHDPNGVEASPPPAPAETPSSDDLSRPE
jgi:hypothetical protein